MSGFPTVTRVAFERVNAYPPVDNVCNLVADPVEYFAVPRTGKYRLWYKTPTAGGWCCTTLVACMALGRSQAMTRAGCRNMTIEQLDHELPRTRLDAPVYTTRDRRFMTRRGI